MFEYGLYSSNALKMEDNCSVCELKYEIQLGFFWGAMFINYAIVVAIFTVETTVLYLLGLMETSWLYFLSPITCLIMLPIIFRTGRVLFLHLFGGIPYSFETDK